MPEPTLRAWRGWPALGLLALHLALAVLVMSEVWRHPASSVPLANRGDAMQDAWMLGWTPWSVTHHSDPWLTQHLNAGQGLNLAWNTLTPLLGLLLWPVTATAGPLAATTVGLTLGLALSGWSLAMLLGRLPAGPRLGRGATALAGLTFAFSPSLVAQSTGHLNFTFLPLVPLILWFALRLAVGTARPWWWDGLGLGLSAGLELLINPEITLLVVLNGLVLALVLARRHREVARRRWRPVLGGMAVAGGVGLLLGGWQVLTQFAGPLPVAKNIYDPNLYDADLAGLVTATPTTLFAHDGATAAVNRLSSGGVTESSGYVGWVLLLLLLAGLAVVRDRGYRLAVGAWAVATVMSLGHQLHVQGQLWRAMLPWALVQPYPVVENVLPVRWVLIGALWLAVALAVGVQEMTRRGYAPLAVAAVLGALVAWVPTPHPASRVAIPRWFTDGAPGVPAGSGVLVLPYPSPARIEPMAWQAAAGYRFTMPGGYFISPDERGTPYVGGVQRPSSAVFTDVTEQDKIDLDGDRLAQLADDLEAWRTQTIVVGPGPHRATQELLVRELLGRGPDERTGGVTIWRHVSPRDVLPGG